MKNFMIGLMILLTSTQSYGWDRCLNSAKRWAFSHVKKEMIYEGHDIQYFDINHQSTRLKRSVRRVYSDLE